MRRELVALEQGHALRVADGSVAWVRHDVSVVWQETVVVLTGGGESMAVPLDVEGTVSAHVATLLAERGLLRQTSGIFDDVGLNEAMFGSTTAAEVSWCLEVLSEELERGERGLDVGCGSGRLLVPLTGAGARMDGLDPNPRALAHARQRLGDAVHLIGSPAEKYFSPSRYGYAISALNTLRYLPTRWALRRHFSLLYDSIRPCGRYLINVTLNPEPHVGYGGQWYFDYAGSAQRIAWEWAGYSHVQKLILERVRLFAFNEPDAWHEEYQLQLALDKPVLSSIVRGTGWRVEEVWGHDRRPLSEATPYLKGTFWLSLRRDDGHRLGGFL